MVCWEVILLTLQEFILNLTASGGFWYAVVAVILLLVEITPIKINPLSWIAKIIGRALNNEVMKKVDSLQEEVKSVKTDVADIREEAKEREATNRRTRILEFGDGILHGVDYSKEHWDSILMDISAYEIYCDDHPRYMNNVAKATIRHIKHVYDNHLETDSFL